MDVRAFIWRKKVPLLYQQHCYHWIHTENHESLHEAHNVWTLKALQATIYGKGEFVFEKLWWMWTSVIHGVDDQLAKNVFGVLITLKYSHDCHFSSFYQRPLINRVTFCWQKFRPFSSLSIMRIFVVRVAIFSVTMYDALDWCVPLSPSCRPSLLNRMNVN